MLWSSLYSLSDFLRWEHALFYCGWLRLRKLKLKNTITTLMTESVDDNDGWIGWWQWWLNRLMTMMDGVSSWWEKWFKWQVREKFEFFNENDECVLDGNYVWRSWDVGWWNLKWTRLARWPEDICCRIMLHGVKRIEDGMSESWPYMLKVMT